MAYAVHINMLYLVRVDMHILHMNSMNNKGKVPEKESRNGKNSFEMERILKY